MTMNLRAGQEKLRQNGIFGIAMQAARQAGEGFIIADIICGKALGIEDCSIFAKQYGITQYDYPHLERKALALFVELSGGKELPIPVKKRPVQSVSVNIPEIGKILSVAQPQPEVKKTVDARQAVWRALYARALANDKLYTEFSDGLNNPLQLDILDWLAEDTDESSEDIAQRLGKSLTSIHDETFKVKVMFARFIHKNYRAKYPEIAALDRKSARIDSHCSGFEKRRKDWALHMRMNAAVSDQSLKPLFDRAIATPVEQAVLEMMTSLEGRSLGSVKRKFNLHGLTMDDVVEQVKHKVAYILTYHDQKGGHKRLLRQMPSLPSGYIPASLHQNHWLALVAKALKSEPELMAECAAGFGANAYHLDVYKAIESGQPSEIERVGQKHEVTLNSHDTIVSWIKGVVVHHITLNCGEKYPEVAAMDSSSAKQIKKYEIFKGGAKRLETQRAYTGAFEDEDLCQDFKIGLNANDRHVFASMPAGSARQGGLAAELGKSLQGIHDDTYRIRTLFTRFVAVNYADRHPAVAGCDKSTSKIESNWRNFKKSYEQNRGIVHNSLDLVA